MRAMVNQIFRKIATAVSQWVGTSYAFFLALLVIIIWAVSGPAFGYSDTWQLVINTGTTIVTFIMVFLIQNTQNRDSKAIHLKLDELLKSIRGARNTLVASEDLSDQELEALHQEFKQLHLHYTKQYEYRQNAKRKREQISSQMTTQVVTTTQRPPSTTTASKLTQ